MNRSLFWTKSVDALVGKEGNLVLDVEREREPVVVMWSYLCTLVRILATLF